MREEVVYLAQVGMRAGWRVEKPTCKIDLAVLIECKMRCDLVVVPGRAGQAKVHELGLEKRHELAADVVHDCNREVRVVEPAVPVAICAA